ncbi:MAG: PKD domain-containing protein [Bacteroidota bacterium]
MKRQILFTITACISLLGFGKVTPEFSPNQDVALCGPTDVFFVCTAPLDPDNIWWDFGDGNLGTGLNPTHRYTTTGVYSVKMIVEKGGIKDSVTKIDFITLKPKPVSAFKSDIMEVPVAFQRKFKFNGEANADSVTQYNWMVNGTAVAGNGTMTHTFPANGVYLVSLTITNSEGCSDEHADSVTIDDDDQPTGVPTTSASDKFSVSVVLNQPLIVINRNAALQEEATINVLDITGRVVVRTKMHKGESSIRMKTDELWPGAYIVELSSQTFKAAKRFDKIML